MSKTVKTAYVEPADFFPKEIRKEFGLGEYYKGKTPKTAKSATKKPATKKK